MFKTFLTEAKETYWVIKQDDDVVSYGPFDGVETKIIDKFKRMAWNNTFSTDVKLIKTSEKIPKDARNYVVKQYTEIMTDNFRLSNAERERLGL